MKNVKSPKPFFDTMEEMPNPFKSPVLDIDSINFNVQDEENEGIDNLNITEYELSIFHHNPL